MACLLFRRRGGAVQKEVEERRARGREEEWERVRGEERKWRGRGMG